MKIYVPLIRNYAGRVVMFHEAVAQQLGLHATDVKALRLLGEDAMTAGRLADNIGLTGAAVTALVDRLEADGYVQRVRDTEDRRRVTIHAVPAKIRKLDQLYDGIYIEMSRLLSKYSKAEFAAITDYLTNGITILAEQTKKLRDAAAGDARDLRSREKAS